MKYVRITARGALVIANTLFALYLFNTHIAIGKAHQQGTWLSVQTIEDSAALDTNALAQYISQTEYVHPDPMGWLKESQDATVRMFDWLTIPALCLLGANVVLMLLFWNPATSKQRKEEPAQQ